MRKSCLGIAVGALFLAAPLYAAQIFINSTDVIATSDNGQAVSTRVKASNGWDIMLGRFENTTSPNDYRSWDFASNPGGTAVINKNLTFILEHRAGQGYIFTVVNPIASGAVTRVLAWGSFSPAVVANSQAAVLNGAAPDLAVNAIRLQSGVSQGGNSQLILSSLAFSISSAASNTSQGSFHDSTTTFSTPASSWTNLAALGSTFADPVGYQSQWIYVDENLTSLSWHIDRDGAGSRPTTQRDENVRLNITGYDFEAEFPMEVPESSSRLLIGVGLAVVGTARLLRKPGSVQPGDDS